jgi:hypothetical protein
MSGWTRQCLAGTLCELGALSGRIEQCSAGDRTLSGWRFLFVDGFEKDLESLNSIIFTLSNTPLLIVWCSYTQEI